MFGLSLRKRPLPEDITSSNESLSYTFSRQSSNPTSGARTVQISELATTAAGPQRSGPKQMRENERIVVSSQEWPMHIYSIIPYNKKHNSGQSKTPKSELKRDGRRRQPSNSRPLSSFNEQSFDAFNLLGLDRRSEHGQEISYGHLLVPSRLPNKEKKHSHHDKVDSHYEVTNALAMRNHGFPR